MWIPLVVLAVLAVVGGLVGIGPAFSPSGGHPGGKANIVTWLEPIIWNAQTRTFGGEGKEGEAAAPQQSRATEEGSLPATAEPYGDTGFNLAHKVESVVHSERGTEWIFIVISLLAAGTGMGLGWLFYVKDTSLPGIWAARLRPLYTASYNKYWVDEFYGWAITRRTMDIARGVFVFDSKVVDGAVNGTAWSTRLSARITGGIDKYFVDGLVNAIAAFVIRLMSPLVRAAQTGLAQNYALMMVIGLLLAVGVFFYSDIVSAVMGH